MRCSRDCCPPAHAATAHATLTRPTKVGVGAVSPHEGAAPRGTRCALPPALFHAEHPLAVRSSAAFAHLSRDDVCYTACCLWLLLVSRLRVGPQMWDLKTLDSLDFVWGGEERRGKEALSV